MADWNCNLCKEYQSGTACTFCDDGSEFNKMSNADKIRSMTDEELAKTLAKEDIPCKVCSYWNENISSCNAPFSFVCTKGYAEALYLQWLQSEAE